MLARARVSVYEHVCTNMCAWVNEREREGGGGGGVNEWVGACAYLYAWVCVCMILMSQTDSVSSSLLSAVKVGARWLTGWQRHHPWRHREGQLNLHGLKKELLSPVLSLFSHGSDCLTAAPLFACSLYRITTWACAHERARMHALTHARTHTRTHARTRTHTRTHT